MKIEDILLLRLIPLTAVLFFTAACFDEIKLDLPESDGPKLVIEGSVDQGEDVLNVFISVGANTGVNDQNGNIQPIPLAQAYLIYNGVPFPQFSLNNNEITRLPAAVFEAMAPGTGPPSFQLFVALPDGRTFRSTPESPPPLPKAEKIEVEIYSEEVLNGVGNIVEQDFLEIKITTPLRSGNTEKSLLRWSMTGVYRFLEAPPPDGNPFEPQNTCYIDHDLSKNQILLFNGRETTEETLIRYPALRSISLNYFFSHGYYITLYQQALSPDAYRYWDQLWQNANQGGGLFDPTPGSVEGNIRNIDHPDEPVLGYFYATQTDTLRHLIRPADVGDPRLYCFTPGNGGLAICQDCTILRGSTLVKPDYWED